ncbi:MAG: hypothetical protein JWN22_420 [Nocardioides sp.]|jgi:hypothetical protein|nr:hypothetical protein [Nocardioides sp.]
MKRFLLTGSALVLALGLLSAGPDAPTTALAMSATTTESTAEATVQTGGAVLGTATGVTTSLGGTFVGGQPTPETFLVGIKEGDWRDLPEGSEFELHQLPSSSLTLGEGTWSVAADPRAIPSRFVSPDGQVDFLIHATDPQTKAAAFHTVSALRVSNLTDGTVGLLRASAAIPDGWVAVPGLPSSVAPTVTDAVAPSPPQLGEGDAGSDDLEVEETSVNAAVNLAELQGIPLQFLTAPTAVANDEGQTGDTSFLLAKPAATDVSMKSTAPWNCREISGYRRNLQTTIATAYPVGGDTSSLTYSASMNTTSGSATSFGGSWSESGTESTSDGWGADFLESTYRRSYRTVITYGYYSCYNVAGYYSYWIFPIKQPGDAFYYYLSSAPNWTRCGTVYNGVTWRRERSDGQDYEWKFGVKAKQYVGFEMFSRHGYSTGSKLRYHVTHGRKQVCGNNDTPGQAGKVQEKY